MAFDAGSAIGYYKLDNSQFIRAVNEAKAANNGMAQSMGESDKKTESMTASFLKAGVALEAMKKGAQIIFDLGKSFVTSASNLENLNAKFTVMLGSANKAKSLVGELRALGAATPFGTEDLANATETLLQFGIEQENVIETLGMLGDVAGNSKERLGSLALVFGQISSAGKLQGQDLLQLINVGFNPLNVIAKKTGESMESLRDKMSRGQIGIDMVIDAFKTATSEGGLFFKNMETQSQTLTGLWSTMEDEVKVVTTSLGTSMLPMMKDIVKYATSFAKSISSAILDKQQIKNIEDERDALNLLVGEITSSNISNEKRQALLKQLSDNYPSFNKLIKEEGSSNETLAKHLVEVNNAYINKIILAKQQQEIDKQLNIIASLKLKQSNIEFEQNKKIVELARKQHQEDQIDLGNKTKTIEILEEGYKKTLPEELRKAKIYANNLTLIGSIKLKEEERLVLQKKIDEQNNISNNLNEKKKELIKSLNINIDEMNELTGETNDQGIKTNRIFTEQNFTIEMFYENYRKNAYQASQTQKKFYDDMASYYLSDREKALQELNKKAEEYRKAGIEEIKITEWFRSEEKKINDKYDEEEDKNNKKKDDKKKAEAKKNAEQIIFYFNYALEAVQSIVNTIADAINASYENELDALQIKYDEQAAIIEQNQQTQTDNNQIQYDFELAQLQDKLKRGEITQKQYDDQSAALAKKKEATQKAIDDKAAADKAALDKKKLDEENEIKKKQFETNKAFAIANIWVNMAVATMAAWAGFMASPGGTAGIVLGAVATALLLAAAIAETVVVSQQQFVPARASGGNVESNQPYTVGEMGREIFVPEMSGTILNSQTSREILNSQSSSITKYYNIDIHDNNISDKMDLDEITDHVIDEIGKRVG